MAEPLVLSCSPEPGPSPGIATPRQCALGTTFVAALARSLGAGGAQAGEAACAGQLISTAQRLGATSLHLSEGPIGQFLDGLLVELSARRAELPVLALDAALGAIKLGRPRAALAAAGSLEREEAQAAVAVAMAAMGLASDLGAPFVTLRLGPVAGLGRLWRSLRGHFLRGGLADEEAPAEALLLARNALAGQHLDAAMRSLERVLTAAERLNITVLLPSPRRAIELPAPIELRALRDEFRGAPLGPQLDAPAAHLASAMHLFSLRDSVLAFGSGPLANLSDGCGAVGGLAPGHGEVDLASIARSLAATTHREFVPWPALHLNEVAAGYRAVAALPTGPG